MFKAREVHLAIAISFITSGCAYQVEYNAAYIPDEEPEYISADEVVLVIPDQVENAVYTGSPSSFTGTTNTLTVPLGKILKEVSEEILRDRFSGSVVVAKDYAENSGYKLGLQPYVRRFDHRYNQLKNLGMVITPQVDVDLEVVILDEAGVIVFEDTYASGWVSGESYMVSAKPKEKINETLHRVLYDLLEQSFADARPVVLHHLGLEADTQ